jgi:hypothetical protein
MSEQKFSEPDVAVGTIEPRELKMSIDAGADILLFDI